MADLPHLQAELVDFLHESVSAADRPRIDAHLAACPACSAELTALRDTARRAAAAAPADELPAGLRERTLAAVQAAASPSAPAAPAPDRPRRSWQWWPAFGLAGATLATVLVVALVVAGPDDGPSGVVEVDTALVRPQAPAAAGSLRVTATGIGRIVQIETDALSVLDNQREFYEVWFVGPGDGPGRPNRVSAGTFHPDEQGRSSVTLAAAVVPADYPVLSITREPRDGDPRATGPEVMRSD